jgi:hypothetical protein
MEDITANNSAELILALTSIDISVPPRNEGRTSEHCERWSICRWLSTINALKEIDFPLRVTKREKPDFQVCAGARVWGVEVTEAVPTDFARASALAARETPDALIDISLFKYGETKTLEEIKNILNQKKLTGEGWAGDSAERELANTVQRYRFKDSKTSKARLWQISPQCSSDLRQYAFATSKSVRSRSIASIDWLATGQKSCASMRLSESGETMFLVESGGIRKLQISDIWRDA